MVIDSQVPQESAKYFLVPIVRQQNWNLHKFLMKFRLSKLLIIFFYGAVNVINISLDTCIFLVLFSQ